MTKNEYRTRNKKYRTDEVKIFNNQRSMLNVQGREEEWLRQQSCPEFLTQDKHFGSPTFLNE